MARDPVRRPCSRSGNLIPDWNDVVDREHRREVGGRPTFVPVEGSELELECDLVVLALGFVGPEKGSLLDRLGVELDDRGNVVRDPEWRTTVPGGGP